MKVLVTGGTGYLGSNLVKALLREGHDVIVLKRSFSDPRRLSDVLDAIVTYDLDRCEITEPFQKQGNLDAVIHTATCYGRKREMCSDIFQANALFPLQLLESAIMFKVPAFLNTDTSLPRELNYYSLSKKQFADWGKFYASQGCIRFMNLQVEHFYGPGDDESKFSTHVIKSCLENLPELKLTKGEQRRDFIYIDDVVEAFLMLMKMPDRHPEFVDCSVGSGKSVTIREFVEKVARLTGTTTLLSFGAIPYRENEVMKSKADLSSISCLGWKAKVSLDNGLRKTIESDRQRPER
jgi:nucleoside-diphosphate-sugar epimerase